MTTVMSEIVMMIRGYLILTILIWTLNCLPSSLVTLVVPQPLRSATRVFLSLILFRVVVVSPAAVSFRSLLAVSAVWVRQGSGS